MILMEKIIYGKYIADKVKEDVKNFVSSLGVRKPRLAVIRVGNDPASEAYVRGKENDCSECGIKTITFYYYEIKEEDLLYLIERLNNDHTIDAILVQLPLPKNINEEKIINAISNDKDVDGFGKENVAKLSTGEKGILPCTPYGVMEILKYIGMNDLSGKHAVVIGRSNIVGKPMARLLLENNATVTVCHSKTENIKNYTKTADILISAVGNPHMIKKDWIKDNSVVIDVGISRKNGHLYGDVDLEDVIDKVSYITPVPKGVGLVTRAMLLKNTVECYKNIHKTT